MITAVSIASTTSNIGTGTSTALTVTTTSTSTISHRHLPTHRRLPFCVAQRSSRVNNLLPISLCVLSKLGLLLVVVHGAVESLERVDVLLKSAGGATLGFLESLDGFVPHLQEREAAVEDSVGELGHRVWVFGERDEVLLELSRDSFISTLGDFFDLCVETVEIVDIDV